MKIFDNSLEVLVIKYTLIGCFVGVTVLFAGKVILLLISYVSIKLAVLQHYLTSGEGMKNIGHWIWQAVTEGRK